ncbi:MAG: hypothetical protein QM765_18480 [Myxococcales bacterium]
MASQANDSESRFISGLPALKVRSSAPPAGEDAVSVATAAPSESTKAAAVSSRRGAPRQGWSPSVTLK